MGCTPKLVRMPLTTKINLNYLIKSVAIYRQMDYDTQHEALYTNMMLLTKPTLTKVATSNKVIN